MKATLGSLALCLAVAVSEARAQESLDTVKLSPAGWTQDSSRVDRSRSTDGNEWHGTVRLFFGAKQLDEDDWEPVDSQGEFAILTDFGPADWAVRLAFDLRFAASEEEEVLGLDVTSSTWELNLGVRKVFDTGSIVKPFLGAGLAFGGATLDIEIDDESDGGVGIWFDGGVDISLGGPVSLGLELSYSTIEIEIADFDTDAGGLRFGITLGFSW
jgi:opacity protein-like surface antigen